MHAYVNVALPVFAIILAGYLAGRAGVIPLSTVLSVITVSAVMVHYTPG